MRSNSDPDLRVAYGCGVVLGLGVAVGFAVVHRPLVAVLGLLIALPVFQLCYLVVKGFVFPLIERVSCAVGRALGGE